MIYLINIIYFIIGNTIEKEDVEKNLNFIDEDKEISKIVQKVTNELLLLGYNFKLKGTQYLLDSIIYVYSNQDRDMLENLERNVYKYISLKNNKTILNIKTSIINSTNYVYDYQNSEILTQYFSSNIKITPKFVIATVLRKIHM